MKCAQRGKFPVVGFIKEPGGIAALYSPMSARWGPAFHAWSAPSSMPEARHAGDAQVQVEEAGSETQGHMGLCELVKDRTVKGIDDSSANSSKKSRISSSGEAEGAMCN